VRYTVEKGKTFLVDGLALVNILSGEVEVFGAKLKTGVQMVIHEGACLPLGSKCASKNMKCYN